MNTTITQKEPKMKKLAMVLAGLMLVVLAGCKTYITDNYDKTFYREDGKTIDHVEKGVLSKEQGPFAYKATRAEGAFIGGEVTMTDPQTGNPMPCLKLLDGTASAGAIPVTSGSSNIVETFGTYREVFRYDTSAWPWVSRLASMSYDRVAGGAGTSTLPSIKAVITVPTTGAEPTVVIEEVKPGLTPSPGPVADPAK